MVAQHGGGRDGHGALRYASYELRANREVIMAAVAQSGGALSYASMGLRADRDFILAAMAHTIMTLRDMDFGPQKSVYGCKF